MLKVVLRKLKIILAMLHKAVYDWCVIVETVTIQNLKNMKSLGQKLMDEARKSNVKLTEHYWGSRISYEGPGHYAVLHFRQKFGGMDIYRSERISVKDLRACETIEALEALLKPENDCASGDPMHYTPRDVRRVELSWTPKES